MIHCTNCRRPYPDIDSPYRCLTCGGVFDYTGVLPYKEELVEPGLPGIWRFRHSFGLPAGAPVVSLGEGNTPLLESEAFGEQVFFKLEYQNPTGSFKDRGSAILVSFLLSRGVQMAIEDSSGNAGASFAAYAARGGIKARIYIPQAASGPKRAQMEICGAEVVLVPGPRTEAAQAVSQDASRGSVYASHAYLPFGMAGYSCIAYEIAQQLGKIPGTVVCPVGHGSLLLGIGRGFEALPAAGSKKQMPALVGVQARACAPIWALFKYGRDGLGWVTEGETLAEGVRVRYPLRGDALIKMVETSQGTFVAVDEEDIPPGREQLSRRGFYVEPTSAVVWGGLKQVIEQAPKPVVVILTGIGYKSL